MRSVVTGGVAAALVALLLPVAAFSQEQPVSPPVEAPAAAVAPAAVAAAAPARPASPQPDGEKPFQIIRAEDRELSCEVLGAEFNSLTASIARKREQDQLAAQKLAAEQQKKQQRRGVLGGLARGALGVASLGGFGVGFDGMIAAHGVGSALDAAQGMGQLTTLISAYRGGGVPSGPPASPQQQRLDRVAEVFRQKGC